MKLFLVILGLTTFVFASDLEWDQYKLKFNKKYNSITEEIHRRINFLKNLKEINNHNELYAKGLSTYMKGVNKFTDLSKEEFRARYLNSLPKDDPTGGIPYVSSGEPVPKSVDYRKLGAVSPVKDQGQCGSCWAFACTATLESMRVLKKNQSLATLSEQQLVDCSYEDCGGGLTSDAYEYIMETGGLNGDDTYPYRSQKGDNFPCQYNKANNKVAIKNYVMIRSRNEADIVDALAKQGPIHISVNANNFHSYREGIFDNCYDEGLNHAVTAVGYGQENENKKYFIVKNSWGLDWGEHGYIRLARRGQNTCGMANRASYPILL